MHALEITGLKKSFKSNFLIKKFQILKGIDIRVEKGEIYGFLGPNGAGKTTTIKCILGLIRPDAGDIRILGDLANQIKTKARIGFLPEQPYFYDYLTAEELLNFTGMLFSLPSKVIAERTKRLLELVGLTKKKDIKLRKFSKGMIQRVGLAHTLIHEPEFIILDEPFSGLDPIGRKELRDIILSLKDEGKTIFFSSHILQDMELMVDRVGIILDGIIKKEGKLSDLISHSVKCFEIVLTGIDPDTITRWNPSVECLLRDEQTIIKAANSDESNSIIRWISGQNGKILSVTPVKMTLEDIFLEEILQ